jgi:hypothetical protein
MRIARLTRSFVDAIEHFQQKCAAVLRPEMRKTKNLEPFRFQRKGSIEAHQQEGMPNDWFGS